MRTFLLAILMLLVLPTRAEPPTGSLQERLRRVLLTEGRPGAEPVLADPAGEASGASPFRAALVETEPNAMRLVVLRSGPDGGFEVVARSAPMGGLRGAQHGFGIESFRFNAPDRLELALSAPTGCGRTLFTHRFAWRQAQWQVTGLEVETSRCHRGGIERDSASSANYLTGQTRRTSFAGAGAPRVIAAASARRPLALADFPPPGPEPAYAELQP